MTFKGYLRADGSAGIRNHVVILTTVGCANGAIVRLSEKNPDAVTMLSVNGCGNAHMSTEYAKVIKNICLHPNVYAAVLIGLGCEPDNAKDMAEQIEAAGRKIFVRTIQTDGGSDKVVEEADAAVKKYLREAAEQKPVDVPLEKLTVGLYFDDDDSNDFMYNKSLGHVADYFVDRGGTAIVTQTRSFIGIEETVRNRAADETVLEKIDAVFRNTRFQMKSYNPSEDFSRFSKAHTERFAEVFGCHSIEHVLDGGEALDGRTGIAFQDGSAIATAAVSNLVASGAQIVIATSGRISLLGYPVAPVLRVCTDNAAYEAATEDADINAAMYSVSELGDKLIGEIKDLANSGKCIAELTDICGGIFETQFRLVEDKRPIES